MALKQCKLCDRDESTHHITQAGLCTACDANLHYWKNRTTSQIMKRARQVDSFQARMNVLLGNVKTLPKAGAGTKRRRKTA